MHTKVVVYLPYSANGCTTDGWTTANTPYHLLKLHRRPHRASKNNILQPRKIEASSQDALVKNELDPAIFKTL